MNLCKTFLDGLTEYHKRTDIFNDKPWLFSPALDVFIAENSQLTIEEALDEYAEREKIHECALLPHTIQNVSEYVLYRLNHRSPRELEIALNKRLGRGKNMTISVKGNVMSVHPGFDLGKVAKVCDDMLFELCDTREENGRVIGEVKELPIERAEPSGQMHAIVKAADVPDILRNGLRPSDRALPFRDSRIYLLEQGVSGNEYESALLVDTAGLACFSDGKRIFTYMYIHPDKISGIITAGN